MSDIFDPNNPEIGINADIVNQRFEQIQKNELTASQEAKIKRTARELKTHALWLNDNLNVKLQEASIKQNWDKVMQLSSQIKNVQDTIMTATKFDEATKQRFSQLPNRKERLTSQEKNEIFHSYHGNPDMTQDMLSNDYRKAQSTINEIVNSDPESFVRGKKES